MSIEISLCTFVCMYNLTNVRVFVHSRVRASVHSTVTCKIDASNV